MHFRGKKQNLFKFHIDVNREPIASWFRKNELSHGQGEGI